MARKFLTPIDMNKTEVRNLIAHLLASDPGSPVEGQLYYNTVTHTLEVYNGTAFLSLGRLDQLDAPAADVALAGFKITGLGAPSAGSDAATKTYADSLIAGISSWKTAVRAASTANVTLASAVENGDTLDGVTLATGDRILLKNQTTGGENGIYVVAASGAPARSTDADAGTELVGAGVWVDEGTANADSGWIQTTAGPITIGTTATVWVQFSGAGQITAGAGLTKSGNTLAAGAGTGITVNADDVAVDTAVVARKFSQDIGDGSTTSIVVTHNLGTLDVHVQVYVTGTTGALVECDVQHTTTNTVTLVFAVAPTSAQYRVTIIG